ncbi:hypothetical protein BCR35DRAFT_314470 [Leucosporidium creatinivorum]|uniref:Uncharacterized protein n=1 Tax=Leucosporidium creatinivorum TaxID=106004 RepID=A0A1Y2EY85_9BASI|nr:hypothetical protein BCR35DRAFT_314470 [Leucosporidium creatinivorum]
MRGKERGHEPNFEEKVAERRERRELEDVQATIASLEKQLAEAQGGKGSSKQQLTPKAEKEQLKALQKQLKEERKKVAELEAEIAEQVVARERAETELVKRESAAKLVEEKEAELKEVQEELKSKEVELEDINGKIVILEGTLQRLRTRAAGQGEDEHSAHGEFPDGVERKASSDLDAMERELSQVQARIEEETRKADELEKELRDVQAEIEASADPSPIPTPQPSVSSASSAHSAFVAQRLLNIINESNKTVNTLREENVSLLMQIAGVAQ